MKMSFDSKLYLNQIVEIIEILKNKDNYDFNNSTKLSIYHNSRLTSLEYKNNTILEYIEDQNNSARSHAGYIITSINTDSEFGLYTSSDFIEGELHSAINYNCTRDDINCKLFQLSTIGAPDVILDGILMNYELYWHFKMLPQSYLIYLYYIDCTAIDIGGILSELKKFTSN